MLCPGPFPCQDGCAVSPFCSGWVLPGAGDTGGHPSNPPPVPRSAAASWERGEEGAMPGHPESAFSMSSRREGPLILRPETGCGSPFSPLLPPRFLQQCCAPSETDKSPCPQQGRQTVSKDVWSGSQFHSVSELLATVKSGGGQGRPSARESGIQVETPRR